MAKRQGYAQQALLFRKRLRTHDEDESFWTLLELAQYEPTLQFCFGTVQAMCLSRDLTCRISGNPCSPEFQRFLQVHYQPFLMNSLRCMFVCGFVPVRFRRLSSGDTVPECLPLGTFRWSVKPNDLGRASTSTQPEDTKPRYIPDFIPKRDEDSRLLKYEIQIIGGNVTEREVYIYEFMQPTMEVTQNSMFYSTVHSPLSSLISEYKHLREAKQRRAHADSWNTRAHVVCSLKDSRVPTDQPKDNFLMAHMTMPSILREHDLFQAAINHKDDLVQKRTVDSLESEFMADYSSKHTPSLHILPKNYEANLASSLNPCEDINFLQETYISSVYQLFKIPPKFMLSSAKSAQESSSNSRIFAAEMQHLCRHLNLLSERVYSIIYPETKRIEFCLTPSPKIEIESIDDLKVLFEIGSISPDMARKLSHSIISSDRDVLTMAKPPPDQGPQHKMVKTTMQHYKPQPAKAASYKPPLKK